MTPTTTILNPVQTVSEVLFGLEHQPAALDGRRFLTGFSPLDAALGGGLRRGDLILLGGLPSVGKTISGLQWAQRLARAGHTAIYACYEHDQATLLGRLLVGELGRLSGSVTSAELDTLRMLLGRAVDGETALSTALIEHPELRELAGQVRSYGDRLWLVRASGTSTDVAALADLVQLCGGARSDTVLFVDYLQKVAVQPEPDSEEEKVTRVTEALKELALALEIPVVAVTAADASGLRTRRVRLHHLRGSGALAYEADVIIMLNEKLSTVSKHHSAYDLVRAAEYRNYVVFTIEKNRSGPGGIELEFRKNFANFRFEPEGSFVREKLIDELFEDE